MGRYASELGLTWPEAVLVVLTAAVVYLLVVVLSRVFGQRQFSQSSTYDLAFVFALGSLVGRVILVRTSLLAAVLGLVTMFTLHFATGWLHHRSATVHRLMQNQPVLLAAHGRVLEDNLRLAHTSHVELYRQLRLSGRASLDGVAAVILEPNGQTSVISDGDRLDPDLLDEVIGVERLATRT